MFVFQDKVIDYLQGEFAELNEFVSHFCDFITIFFRERLRDPAGQTENGVGGLTAYDFLNQLGVCSVDQNLFANVCTDHIYDTYDVSFFRLGGPAAYQIRADSQGINMGDVAVQHMGTVAQLTKFFSC